MVAPIGSAVVTFDFFFAGPKTRESNYSAFLRIHFDGFGINPRFYLKIKLAETVGE